jgi:hypothetical protein
VVSKASAGREARLTRRLLVAVASEAGAMLVWREAIVRSRLS